MKKCWMLLLALLLVVAVVPLTSCMGPDLTYSVTLDNKTCVVTGTWNYPETELVIPSESPDGYTVAGVAEEAFAGCSNFSAITVPNSVLLIGENAFRGCSTLKSITLPFIGSYKDSTYPGNLSYLFGDVPLSLEDVVITGGTIVADRAFADCPNLINITLPGSIMQVGADVFAGCTSLQTITYGDTMKSWQSVEKDDNWRRDCPVKVIYCTDGIVSYYSY